MAMKCPDSLNGLFLMFAEQFKDPEASAIQTSYTKTRLQRSLLIPDRTGVHLQCTGSVRAV